MYWTSLIVTVWKVILLKRNRTLVSAGAFSNVDAFSNAPQYFYHTSVSYAIAIKLLNWCLYGASPVQGTVIWNISFEVLMDHLYADIVGAKNEWGELSRASNACGGFPAELPAGSCCQPLLPVLDHLQEPKVGQSCVAFLVSLSVQPLHSYSGSGSRAASAPLCWKCRVQSCILVSGWVVVFFFTQEKSPWLY